MKKTIIHNEQKYICSFSNWIDAYKTENGKLRSNIYEVIEKPYKSVGIYLISENAESILYVGMVYKNTHGFKRLYRYFQQDNSSFQKALTHEPFPKHYKIKIVTIDNPDFSRLSSIENYFIELYKPTYEMKPKKEYTPNPEFIEVLEDCPF